MKKLHLLNLIIIVFFLASCQEDDIEKTTEELIIGEWQWVAEDGNPRNLEIEYSQPYNYGNCELDGVNIDYKLEKEYKITFRDDLSFVLNEHFIEYKHDFDLLYFDCEIEYNTYYIDEEYVGEYLIDVEANTINLITHDDDYVGILLNKKYNIEEITEAELKIIRPDNTPISNNYIKVH